MNLFDILGPVMVGPSSSHTAGAVRIGLVAEKLLKDRVKHVDIILHGSFATTGVGHGTDKALIAGLLGMEPDDIRIPNSFELAALQGLTFTFCNRTLKDAHPNTALMKLTGHSGRSLEIQAASIGGGRIMIHKLDGVSVVFSAEKPTLIVYNQDQPGYVAQVTTSLADRNVNIATMNLYRDKRGGFAVMVLETDQKIPTEAVIQLEQLPGIRKVSYIDTEEREDGI